MSDMSALNRFSEIRRYICASTSKRLCYSHRTLTISNIETSGRAKSTTKRVVLSISCTFYRSEGLELTIIAASRLPGRQTDAVSLS